MALRRARRVDAKPPSSGPAMDATVRRLTMSDVDMDGETEEESGRASPVLTKTLFGGGFSDSSSAEEEEDEDEENGYTSGRRTSYRSRSRRLSGLTHPTRASVPENTYKVVTPMKATRAAPRRRLSIERCETTAAVQPEGSLPDLPLQVKQTSTSPKKTKRIEVTLPEKSSPVHSNKELLSSTKTPKKRIYVSQSPTSRMSISTTPTPPRRDNPLTEAEEAAPMDVSFKSPVPPTPLKQRTPTPARQKFLSKKQVLIEVQYPSDSPETKQTNFQDLETVSWIGAGVSAEVSKVYSRKEDRFFAVKKTKHELRSERERDILLQEIVVAKQIAASGASFDHIVRYYQAWQDNGHLFVQTELCTGGNLRDFVAFCEGRNIAEDCLWTILNHVGQGLESLHSNDIVHLDIKPENIFIASDGNLKIGDLGMAAQNSSKLKRVDDLEGDPAYMAKELLTTTERSPHADVFCLGIMMLELATGMALPTSGDEWHALRSGDLPTLPTEYTPELRSAISQMMHPDPRIRPTAAEIVSHPHIQSRSTPAPTIVEHANRFPKLGAKTTPTTIPSETPRKPRLSLSLFSDD